MKKHTHLYIKFLGILCILLLSANFMWASKGVAYAWPNTSSKDKSYSLATGVINCGVYVSLNGNSPSGAGNYYQYDESDKGIKNATGNFCALANTGYVFIGWYSDADYSTLVSTDNPYTPSIAWNKTLTLYAKFAKVYYVSFKGNGSTSGSMSNQTFKYDEAQTLTSNAYSRSYTVTYNANGGTSAVASNVATYTFTGWEDRGSIEYNSTTYSYTTFDAPHYANTYSDLYSAFGYNKYSLIDHYVKWGSGEGRSPKGATPGLYPNKAVVNNLTTTANGTVDLYANWTSASVILPSVTKDGCVFDGWYDGDTKIGEAGDSYTPTANITLKAKWLDKYTPSITGSNQTLLVDGEQTNAFTFVRTDGPVAHISVTSINPINNGDGQVISYDAANNKIIAHNAGVATIYFTQAETSTVKAGTSATYTYTVNKIDNTLSVTSAYTKYVDESITGVIANKNSNAAVTTSSSDATIAYYNVGENKIYIPNSSAKSFSTCNVTIDIAQAETYKYKATGKNIVVAVNKYTPEFTWNPGSVAYYYKSKSYDIFSSTSPCSYNFESNNPVSAIAVKGVKDTLIIYNVEESATITVTQEENYLWNGKTQDYVITPVNQNDHVPFIITNSNYTVFEKSGSDKLSWKGDGYYQMGDGTWLGERPEAYVIIGFTGLPEALTFTMAAEPVELLGTHYPAKEDYMFEVYESATNGDWGAAKWSCDNSKAFSDLSAEEKNIRIPLSSTTRYIKLRYKGACWGRFANIHVSELKKFDATPASIDFGLHGATFGIQEESLNFDHANAGRITNVTITGTDAEFFSAVPTSIPGTGRDLFGSTTLRVSFDNKDNRRAEGESYNATLVVSDNIGHVANVPLTGQRFGKTDPVFTWNANHVPYYFGNAIAHVASSSNTDYENCPLSYESSNSSIAYVDAEGRLHIGSTGSAVTITVRQGANTEFKDGSASFTFTPRERPNLSVPFQMTKALYDEDVMSGNKCGWDNDNQIYEGNAIWGGFVWGDTEKSVTLAFNGTPDKLSFAFKNSSGVATGGTFFAGVYMWEVEESADGDSWHSVWGTDDVYTDWQTIADVELRPTTQYIRFTYRGNFAGYFKDINVSELQGYKYLRASDGKYLSRGAKWGTQAVVDEFGMVCRITRFTLDNTNIYTRFQFMDNRQYLFETVDGSGLREMFTDNATAANTNSLWKLTTIDGTILTVQSANGLGAKDQYVTVNGNVLALTSDASAATRWEMEEYIEHPAYIKARLDREAAEAASHDFLADINTLEKVRAELRNNDFDSTAMVIPNMSRGEVTGEYRSGVAGTNAVFDHVVDTLTPGFYRLTVQAFYRISTADAAWACHANNMESVLAYVYANNVKSPIASVYDETGRHLSASSVGTDEMRDGYFYAADSAAASHAFEDPYTYQTDVYVYIPADAGKETGTLRYGVKIPSYVPGAWLAYKTLTLTRFARKEFIFEGTEEDATDWETANNWNRNLEPNLHNIVIIRHDVEIDEEVAIYELRIENEAKVFVMPTGGLTVGAGGVKGTTTKNFILKAGQEGATKGQTGYLRVSPYSTQPMPQATVELFITAYYNASVSGHQDIGTWQYIGSPMVGGTAARTVFPTSMLYDWSETTGTWKNNLRKLVLQPFTGYATSQYKENGTLITNTGQLVDNGTIVLPLTYTEESATPGCNVFANSFAAPIDITRLKASDFSDGVEASIHMFNAGSKADVERVSESKDFDVNAAGQYLSIPVATARTLGEEFGYPTIIPAMQGFYINTNKAGSLTLDYERLVWNADLADNSNKPLRVKAQIEDERPTTGSLMLTLYTEGLSDNVYVLESEKYDAMYENGYDASKKMSCSFNVFTIEEENHLAVDATNSIIGTRVGVRTGDETAYTFVFGKMRSENELALFDAETSETIDINEGTEYTFFAEPNSMIMDRFQIVERDNAPAITTDIDNVENETKAHKFIKNNQLYILKNGVLYSATGAVVR